MLDNRAELLLNYLCKNCGNGYKIVTIKEMLSVFPQHFSVSEQDLKHIIKTLVNGEYILNKYADLEVYCLYCLPKGKYYLEEQLNKQNTDKSLKTQVVKLVFFSSFLGASLGSVITLLLALIIKIC